MSVGSMIKTALTVREALKDKGYNCSIINARFVKPIDTDTFELQEKIDSRINQIDNTGIEEVEVKIEGIDESIRIKGNLITETIDGIEITTFVPNKIEDE